MGTCPNVEKAYFEELIITPLVREPLTISVMKDLITAIKKVIKNLMNNKTNCVVTLKRIEHEHPYRAKKLNTKTQIFKQFIKGVNVEKFMSRQDLPTLYCTSGAIYARSFDLPSSPLP